MDGAKEVSTPLSSMYKLLDYTNAMLLLRTAGPLCKLVLACEKSLQESL